MNKVWMILPYGSERIVSSIFKTRINISSRDWFLLEAIPSYNHLETTSYRHGPLTRYATLRVARAPAMFSPPPQVSDHYMHHGTCVTHVPWCIPESLTSSFLWGRWRGKRFRNSRHMRNPQLDVSGKRPIGRGRPASGRLWFYIVLFGIVYYISLVS